MLISTDRARRWRSLILIRRMIIRMDMGIITSWEEENEEGGVAWLFVSLDSLSLRLFELLFPYRIIILVPHCSREMKWMNVKMQEIATDETSQQNLKQPQFDTTSSGNVLQLVSPSQPLLYVSTSLSLQRDIVLVLPPRNSSSSSESASESVAWVGRPLTSILSRAAPVRLRWRLILFFSFELSRLVRRILSPFRSSIASGEGGESDEVGNRNDWILLTGTNLIGIAFSFECRLADPFGGGEGA